jgi:hypothetical protein
MLGRAHCSFHKKRIRTRYAELVLLHPVGAAGHIVHSGASGAQNVDTIFSIRSGVEQIRLYLCFCIWWDLHVTLCISVRPGHETSMDYFPLSVGPGAVSIKSAGHVTLKLCFCIRWNM